MFSYLRIIRFLVNPLFKTGIRQLQYLCLIMVKVMEGVQWTVRTYLSSMVCAEHFEGGLTRTGGMQCTSARQAQLPCDGKRLA
jgi:hypothetical protein